MHDVFFHDGSVTGNKILCYVPNNTTLYCLYIIKYQNLVKIELIYVYESSQIPAIYHASCLSAITIIEYKNDGIMQSHVVLFPVKRMCFQILPSPVDPTSPGRH